MSRSLAKARGRKPKASRKAWGPPRQPAQRRSLRNRYRPHHRAAISGRSRARSQRPRRAGASRSRSRVAANSAPKTAGPSVQAPVGYGGSVAVNSGEDERPLLARLKQIPSWFLPENDRIFSELPRPPMPVGEFLQSSM